MEELIAKLYNEFYLNIDEISRTTKMSKQSVAMCLWKHRMERSGALTMSLRKRLKTLEKEEKIRYVKKARDLKIPYSILAKLLGVSHETVRKYANTEISL
jgi:hypothetical protein